MTVFIVPFTLLSRAVYWWELETRITTQRLTYYQPLVLPLLVEILQAVTSGTYSGVTGTLDVLVITEVDHEPVIFIVTSKAAAAFTLTHSSSLFLSVKKPSSVDKQARVTCNQSDSAGGGTLQMCSGLILQHLMNKINNEINQWYAKPHVWWYIFHFNTVPFFPVYFERPAYFAMVTWPKSIIWDFSDFYHRCRRTQAHTSRLYSCQTYGEGIQQHLLRSRRPLGSGLSSYTHLWMFLQRRNTDQLRWFHRRELNTIFFKIPSTEVPLFRTFRVPFWTITSGWNLYLLTRCCRVVPFRGMACIHYSVKQIRYMPKLLNWSDAMKAAVHPREL